VRTLRLLRDAASLVPGLILGLAACTVIIALGVTAIRLATFGGWWFVPAAVSGSLALYSVGLAIVLYEEFC